MSAMQRPLAYFDLQDSPSSAGSSPKRGQLVPLAALEQDYPSLRRLPVSIRMVLESLLRNLDGKRVRESDVRSLANWQPKGPRTEEVPFVVARVLLQDFTGVPLLVDLAAMRSAAARLGRDPKRIEPLVPVDLVIDHSIQVDEFGHRQALLRNLTHEFARNGKRYEFLKWGTQAFSTFRIVPPGVGICHQVNLEYLAQGVLERDGVYFPDTLVGTDSHTTMINGLGIVGFGVGGIEAEAAMLGQPVSFLQPDVVGVHLHGKLPEGTTATDLVLRITQLLRQAKVVGKFVEFHGEGVEQLPVPDRATVANMCPEYGATVGFFPIDERTCEYLERTGRAPERVAIVRNYLRAQGLFGVPKAGSIDYTQVVDLDLSTVTPSVAGPKRPQDRIELPVLGERFSGLLAEAAPGGYGKSAQASATRHPVRVQRQVDQPDGSVQAQHVDADLGDGDVLIAAITSCTNTSNPTLMVAAGLVARKARSLGLRPKPTVKTSLAPGSRVVSEYLERSGLQEDFDAIGFNTVGYGCTTCIGNSGPIDPALEEQISKSDVVVASVLSGNRNFEARVHAAVRANFLMSPPLVVAFALAGTVRINLASDPLGTSRDGKPVYLRDLWPTPQEVEAIVAKAANAQTYQQIYEQALRGDAMWAAVESPTGLVYAWDYSSTYVREPPYFEQIDQPMQPVTDVRGARALAVFGDSITTDHISPAGSFKGTTPAGKYLLAQGVAAADFNSYGARRGNHEVMLRGTFANVRIKNLMVPSVEGGVTVHQPSGERQSIYDASVRYQAEGTPLFLFAGHEYGTGSSRDWAAKGTRLLGVRVVFARSFERIHRSNLVGMGVLPCELPEGVSAETLVLTGTETFDLLGLDAGLEPRMQAKLAIHRSNGTTDTVPVTVRVDTPVEVDYLRNGGILPYVLRQLLA